MSKLTDIEKKLIQQLRKVWDNFDFVVSILSYLKDDVERKLLSDFIESDTDVDSEQITLFALDIENIVEETFGNLILDDFSIAQSVEVKKE